MGILIDEFAFATESCNESVEYNETSFETDSLQIIARAKQLLSNKGTPTIQGISKENWSKCLKFNSTDIIPWKHSTLELDVSNLRNIANNKLEELLIPDFVEELQGSGDKHTGFGYNETGRSILHTLVLSPNLIVLSDNALAFHKKLENVIIPTDNKLLYIGKRAFAYCEGLKKLDLSKCLNLDRLFGDTFSFSSLTSLKISSNISQMTPLLNTSIKTVTVDNDTYNIEQFNTLLEESNQLGPSGADKVFWDQQQNYDF